MKICLFGGASPNIEKTYYDFAYNVGKEIAKAGHLMVFGGGAKGIMGAAADGVVDQNGKVIGVLPNFLFTREPPHPNVSDIRVVETMHERKMQMYELADAFFVLPGGFGTFEEAMEVVTWRQLSIHDKPAIFIGIDGFWRGVKTNFDTMKDVGFLSERDYSLVCFTQSVNEALRLIKV